MEFEILIDETFSAFNSDTSLAPIENKSVLSIINDFADKHWRFKKFQNFIWDNVAETSLTIQERESLTDQSHSLLTAAAQNLRLTDKKQDVGRGSELAEICLYGIMKHHYQALPVVPKIFYKQNSQDNAKGADSVHIVIEGGNDFSIWFGEAKFFNDIADARLNEIVRSVGHTLKTGKLEKENSIITNVSDIDRLIKNDKLKKKIKAALSPKESIDKIKPKLHVPILLLHECEITENQTCMSDEYREKIKKYHKQRAQSYFKKQLQKLGNTLSMYSQIKFHIILFPVPSKQKIVNSFISNVEHYKKQ